MNAFLDKIRADLERKKQEQIKLYQDIEDYLARIASNKVKIEGLEYLINITIPEKIKEYEAEIEKNRGVIAELDKKIIKIAEEVVKLQEERVALEAKSKEVKIQVDELQNEINKLEAQMGEFFVDDEDHSGDDLQTSEEINKELAVRDEIRSRIKTSENDLRVSRNNYTTYFININDLEKALAKDDRIMFKYNYTIDTLEAEIALENGNIESLKVATTMILEEIGEMEKLKEDQSYDIDEKNQVLDEKIEAYEEEIPKKVAEKKALEEEQVKLDPRLRELEDKDLELIASIHNVQNNLSSTNTLFESQFFGSMYAFIVTPNRFTVADLFASHNATIEKRNILKEQYLGLVNDHKQVTAEIKTVKAKQAEFRDLINKKRIELSFLNSKIDKNRSLKFMLNKNPDQIQEYIEEKQGVMDGINNVINEKTAENERRTAALNETREKTQQLVKEVEHKRGELMNFKNNRDQEQDKIVSAAILYERANNELSAHSKSFTQNPDRSSKNQTERFELDKKLRELQRQYREKLKEHETLTIIVTTFEEYISNKKNEERPIQNEKRIHLGIIEEIEAAIERELADKDKYTSEKLEFEADISRLEELLAMAREKVEINKLTIQSKEEIIALNQPFIPNITEHTTFY